ncbi:MAG: YCF48-related protein [Armatimonadota bacterium]|nr:YCF48-related protein [bacterium]MDW8320347.1 YCF48-related protein [Armatimonadota bacterium]
MNIAAVMGVLWMLSVSVVAAHDISSMTLRQKAEQFEQDVLRKHWLNGLYIAQIECPPEGQPADHTTEGGSDVAHSINWTCYYLSGEIHRYLLTQRPADREHCRRIFQGLLSLTQVSGIRGFIARGYVKGRGETREERLNPRNSRLWHQGVPPYEEYRWRGSPSHHTYSSAAHAFALYALLVADEQEKKQCAQALEAIVEYWLDRDMNVYDEYGNLSDTILGFTDGRTPSLNVVMALSALRIAHHFTGKAKFLEAHERLAKQYGVRGYTGTVLGVESFDDTNHVYHHLEVLMRIEKDESMKAFYRHVAQQMWQAHQRDRCPLYTYIHFSLFPDTPGKEEALQNARWTLQHYPTDKVFRPRMNSLRADIAIKDGRAVEPLPLHESPRDNEFQWKGDPYVLDGWLSRPVVSVAVSSADEYVWFALEGNGTIYRTRDGGKTWRKLDAHPPERAHLIATGKYAGHLYAAAGRSLYQTLDGGSTWAKLPLPAEAGTITQVFTSRKNANTLYVVAEGGVYSSRDHGEEWIGHRWDCLTEDAPPARERVFAVSEGEPARVYALLDGVIWSRKITEELWQKGAAVGIENNAPALPILVADCGRSERVYAAFGVNYGAFRGSVLCQSEDAGKSHSHELQTLFRRMREEGPQGLMRDIVPATLRSLALDNAQEGVLWAQTERGVMRLEPSQRVWRTVHEGLEIPVVHGVFVPYGSKLVFCSTPAGLYVLEPGAHRWRSANLTLIFEDNKQREVGSADFLEAYWRGRYFGFLAED